MASACLATILVGGAPALADIELPSVPPPQPARISARVFLGESIDVPLSGVSRSGAGLQFHIKRQPVSGRLSAVRMTGPNAGVVTYTHDAKAGIGLDRFRYAVSAPGIGVSAPAEVTVNVIERPAVFLAPARLDFADTPVGKSERKTIEIRNDGGGTIEGRLIVPQPWEIVDGDGSYLLGPGDSQMLAISFAPADAQLYSVVAQFTHTPGFELGLNGRGYDPIEIVPREIRLTPYGRDEARRATCVLRNVSNEDREVDVSMPREVIAEGKFFLPAHSESQMTLYTREGFLGELEGQLVVTGEGVTIRVPLRIVATPPRIVAEPTALDFGTIEPGRTGRKKIMVRNIGGSPASLKVDLPSGIRMTPDPTFEKIPPGASREIEVSFSTPRTGQVALNLIFDVGESKVQVPIHALVKPTLPLVDGASQQPAARGVAYSDIPPVMQVGVTRQTRTELDLAWKKTSPDVVRYELFLRSIIFDEKGRPQFKLQRLDRVKVRFVRSEARVTLTGLRAGESVTICIVGFDKTGVPSPPSPPFTLATQPKPVFRFSWFWLVVVAAATLVMLIVWERRKIRAAVDTALARLEQS